MTQDARTILRANGWRAGHPRGDEELWEHPSGPTMGWWSLDAAMGQLARDITPTDPEHPVILNPEAIGNPDMCPVVQLPKGWFQK